MTEYGGVSHEILLIEDNPGDARLTREALHEAGVKAHLSVVSDGVEAMSYLRKEGKYVEKGRPDIILLDLNMPKKDGREVLADVKRDPDLRRIPIIVLTSSQARKDVLNSYDLHANCYITKPVDLEEFMKVVRSTMDFWLNTAKLPRSQDDET